MPTLPGWVWKLGLVVLVLFAAFKYGQHDRQKDWDASVARGKAVVDRLNERANTIKTVIQTRVEYRDRIIEKAGKDREVVREVFVPRDSGFLSGGFRLYHDAAATNSMPDASRLSYAAPVAVADVTSTIDGNYELCHKAYARIESWKEYAAEVAAFNEEIKESL